MVEKMRVAGTAIVAGISRNNVKYLPEELKKFSPTLASRPILKDHVASTDNTIGLVEKTKFANNDTVLYEGWIKEEKTQEKVEDGRIKEVSIGAIAGKVVIEDEDDPNSPLIVKDLVGMELSTTPTPGVVGTSIQQSIKGLTEARTQQEVMKVKPVMENVNLFESIVTGAAEDDDESNSGNHSESKNNKFKEDKMEDNQDIEAQKLKEQNQKLADELADYKAKEAKEAEEKRIDEAVKVKYDAKVKEDADAEVAAKKAEDEKAEADKKAPEGEADTKGGVSDDADGDDNKTKEQFDGYKIEKSESVKGFALWKE